jgi:hypothetical protein
LGLFLTPRVLFKKFEISGSKKKRGTFHFYQNLKFLLKKRGVNFWFSLRRPENKEKKENLLKKSIKND